MSSGHEARASGLEQRFVVARVPLAADEEQGPQRRVGGVAGENHPSSRWIRSARADPVDARQGVAELALQPAPAVAPGQAEPGGERTQPGAKRHGRARGCSIESAILLSRDRPRPDAQLHAPPALRHHRPAVRERAVPHRPHHGVHPGRHLGAVPAHAGPRGALRLRRRRARRADHDRRREGREDAAGSSSPRSPRAASPTSTAFTSRFDNWHSTDAPENHELAQGHLPRAAQERADRTCARSSSSSTR